MIIYSNFNSREREIWPSVFNWCDAYSITVMSITLTYLFLWQLPLRYIKLCPIITRVSLILAVTPLSPPIIKRITNYYRGMLAMFNRVKD